MGSHKKKNYDNYTVMLPMKLQSAYWFGNSRLYCPFTILEENGEDH